MTEDRRSEIEQDGNPNFADSEDQPAGSKVDGYAPKYPEPEDASVTEPESRSGANVGTARWECLTCGRTYTEDSGTCPEDGAPLRKTGVVAEPVGDYHHDNEPRPMATQPDQTPEGYESKPATASKEPSEGSLSGESGPG